MSSYKSDVTLEEIRVKAIELNHRFFNSALNISRIKFDYSKSSLYYGWELQLDNSKYDYMIKMDVGTLSKRYLWPRVLCHELLHVYTDMKVVAEKLNKEGFGSAKMQTVYTMIIG